MTARAEKRPAAAAQHTISLLIRTSDTAWTAAYAKPGPEPSTAVVTVPASAAERITFAGADMISFDLGQAAERLPSDWGNQHAAVPLAHHVDGPLPERTPSGRSSLYNRNRHASELLAAGLSAPEAAERDRHDQPTGQKQTRSHDADAEPEAG